MKLRSTIWTIYLFLFLFSSFAFASGHIIIYDTKEGGSEINKLKRYLERNKLKVSLYNKTDQLDKHIENLKRINSSNASCLIALNIDINERENIFIVIPDIKGLTPKPQGRFNFLEEVPGIFEKDAKELAGAIASPFNAKIKTLPLFFAVGVNMPCIFVNMNIKKGNENFFFEKLYSGIQSYLARGEKNERQWETKR
ncbi:MAG TPA: hypothetical protein PKZ54_06560 [Syntrophorhabdaceae bacterium]|nr:hypothetical protein [Syntrophorhabdaceae bacterium]